MKNIFLLIITSFILASCGNDEKSVETIVEEGNLSEIRAKKSELTKIQQELREKIAVLDAGIDSLNTNDSRTLVTVQPITDTIFKHFVEVQGNIGTDENIIIYPEYSGVLTQIFVEEGQQVSKGQVLAKINEGGLSSQLAQLKSQAALAETTFERQKRLWEQNIGSEIQFLEAKSNFEATQSAVEQIESQLSKTVVTAPFSGVVDQILSDQGEVVNPGQNQLFRLIDLNEMYVTADVPENYLGSIEPGTTAIIEINAIGKEYIGEVQEVSSYINPNNRSFEIKVSVPNNEGLVKPNLIATVKLNNYTSENAIVVPQNVIQENAQGEQIAYIVESTKDSEGIAKQVMVETGLNYQGNIEIIRGLKPGQNLILNGARSIRDGEGISIINNGKTSK